MIYTKRPDKSDASQKAWDYAIEKYGIPEKMIFYHSCCSKALPFWTVLINGNVIKIKTEEIRAFVAKPGKNNLSSTITKVKI